MRITPRDVDKLLLHVACDVAQRRYARGLRLNYPEAVALLSGVLLEFIRDGHSLAELCEMGRQILGTDDVMEGVPQMLECVQVEGTLLDGTKMVSVHQPICQTGLNNGYALYGSGLTRQKPAQSDDLGMGIAPGGYELADTPISINQHRPTLTLKVKNTGSRAVQVGSHCNFAEVNRAMRFDRLAAIGYRLDIPAGTAIRFEPGEERTVDLVQIAGERLVRGGNGLVEGGIVGRDDEVAVRMAEKGFLQK